MITMYAAYTEEVDDLDSAVAEILEQVDISGLPAHSVGILFCHYEFIESGVAGELCARLPFEVIGMTTMAGASGGRYNAFMLNLAVLSADDVSFRIAVTAPLSAGNAGEAMAAAYREALSALPGDPSFIISLFPFLSDISSAEVLKQLDSACGGIPVWGSVASGMDMSYNDAGVIFNGQMYEKSAVLLLLHGAVEPEFIVASIPDKNLGDRRARITESSGCVLKKINNIPLMEYFDDVGIVMRIGQDNTTIPLMVDYGDGAKPVALAIYSLTPENWAVCGGEVPEGAFFFCGEIDREGILESARDALAQIQREKGKACALMLPCVTRYIMMTPEQDEEMRLVCDTLKDKGTFVYALSGGEICPVKDRGGVWRNRHHNFTFSACLL
ncbi:MAG: FIST C-terminal domain-containing protein [Deltaproteobacteria bacterium]|jgi:hypothetical protein|nr:FIST C-terminal domain-containing protein [Deltaproteobacteria bacterium]